uniref:Uncharacterized protein n=1 Tax=Arundo donax TaxID=35708 RepID=A0A0A9HRR3_ARUDO
MSKPSNRPSSGLNIGELTPATRPSAPTRTAPSAPTGLGNWSKPIPPKACVGPKINIKKSSRKPSEEVPTNARPDSVPIQSDVQEEVRPESPPRSPDASSPEHQLLHVRLLPPSHSRKPAPDQLKLLAQVMASRAQGAMRSKSVPTYQCEVG